MSIVFVLLNNKLIVVIIPIANNIEVTTVLFTKHIEKVIDTQHITIKKHLTPKDKPCRFSLSKKKSPNNLLFKSLFLILSFCANKIDANKTNGAVGKIGNKTPKNASTKHNIPKIVQISFLILFITFIVIHFLLNLCKLKPSYNKHKKIKQLDYKLCNTNFHN